MRISIIAVDNTVVIDGKHNESDCSGLVADRIRALQWYGDHGEVEFVDHVSPNERITDLAPFQRYIDAAKPPPEPEPMSPEEHIAFQQKWLDDHPKWVQQREEYDRKWREKIEKDFPPPPIPIGPSE